MAAVSMPAMNSMATASPSIPNEPNDSSIDIIVNLLRSCASVQEFALACQMLTCVFLSSGSMSGLSPQLGGSFSAGSDSDSTADTAAGRSIRDELTTVRCSCMHYFYASNFNCFNEPTGRNGGLAHQFSRGKLFHISFYVVGVDSAHSTV